MIRGEYREEDWIPHPRKSGTGKCGMTNEEYFQMKDKKLRSIKQLTINFFLLSTLYFLLSTLAYAELIERVVAIVNDEVILLSEFEEAFQDAATSEKEKTGKEFLNKMINRILLLEQARRFRLGVSLPPHKTPDDNSLINEYIETRIKAFIHIPFEELESYYSRNREQFGDKKIYEVKDEIETHLKEERLNKKLSKHIEELREKAYIRVQLEIN